MDATAVEQRRMDLLKRQLTVLNYQDSFDSSSYDLVKKLVTDLVHTTETYQNLKHQSFEQHQEISAFRSKVMGAYVHTEPKNAEPTLRDCLSASFPFQIDAIKKDSARVVRENNSLHVQLIQRDEELNSQQATHYQRVKELEREISELSFWKHQATTRLEQSERGKSEVTERLSDVLKMGVSTGSRFDWEDG